MAVGTSLLAILVVLALGGHVAPPYNPFQVGVAPPFTPPTAPGHLLGTDELGRDLLSRVMAGIGTSLFVGLIAATLSTAIGAVVGAIAAYAGGATEVLLMRLADFLLIIPPFFVGIVLLAIVGSGLSNLIAIIALLSWPLTARVVRSEVLSLKTRPFVDAARVAGAPPWELVLREILPNVEAPILITGALLAGQAILLEASLSYLGLGDANQVSIGVMLQQSEDTMRLAWWATLFPGLAMFLSILAVNLIADGLRLHRDPRQ